LNIILLRNMLDGYYLGW